MLELRDVHKQLGGRTVLAGVSLRVGRGETLVIVGPSGVGKSVTLLHMVGLLQPDEGQVLVDGADIHAARGREQDAIRDKFGMLFQSGALINWLNLFENVSLPLYEKTRLGDAAIAEVVREKLALVGLEGQEKKMPAALSGGMKKRAGLARALARNPAIILYDEPTSGLDPILSRSIDRLIRDLQSRLSVTSVVVTHDLHSAFSVGDTIAMLHDGRIVEMGSPQQFAASQHPVVRSFMEAQFTGLEGKGGIGS